MFASNLKYLREKKNFDQLELANKLGRKSASTVSEWEKGKYTPKLKTLNELSKLFNVDIDDLMNVDLSKSNDLSATTLTLINDTSKQLNDDKQVEVLEFAKQKLTEQEINVVEFPQQVVDLSNTTMFAFDGKEISAEDRKVIEKVIQDRLNKQNKKNGDDIE